MIVAFGYGLIVAQFRTFPYYEISAVSRAATEKFRLQLAQLIFSKKHEKYPFVWFETEEPSSGVIIHKQGKTSPGVTFFSDCTSSAFLIDMQGNVLHQWHKPFDEAWPQAEHIEPYLSKAQNEMIKWRKAMLLPNGDVLAIYEGAFTPYGGGLIKVDAQSNIIWKSAINAHHDLDVDRSGKIFVLTQKYDDGPGIRIDDFLTILSPDGKILKEISLLESFLGSPFAALIPVGFHFDYLHTNSVTLLTNEISDDYPFLLPGDIMLSHNGINAVTVLDGVSYRVKWALVGIARLIHDADFIGHGRITLFNNLWQQPGNLVGSRIVEWDCIRHQQTWTFTPFDFFKGIDPFSQKIDKFRSLTSGSQQLLPNGNYLITESNGGTLYEVTREKEVVWKYVTTNFDGNSVGGIYWAERYPVEALSFLGSSGDFKASKTIDTIK